MHTGSTAAASGQDFRGKHGREEVIGEAKARATAAEDALIAGAAEFEGVLAACEGSVHEVKVAVFSHQGRVEL